MEKVIQNYFLHVSIYWFVARTNGNELNGFFSEGLRIGALNLCQIREESGHFLSNKMREKQNKRNKKSFSFQISNRLGSNAGERSRNWGDSLPACFLLESSPGVRHMQPGTEGKQIFVALGWIVLDKVLPWQAWLNFNDGPFCRGMLKELMALPAALPGCWGPAMILVPGMAFLLRDSLKSRGSSQSASQCVLTLMWVYERWKKIKAVQRILLFFFLTSQAKLLDKFYYCKSIICVALAVWKKPNDCRWL